MSTVASPEHPRHPRPSRLVRLMATTALATALVGAPAACGDGAGDTTRSAGDEPALWTLESDVRIGSLEGEGALSRVGRVAVGPDGRIFVSLPQEQRVAVFGSDGEPVGSVGRQGEGPGEFVSPSYLGFLADTLWVHDSRQRRISFFDAAGEHVGDHPVPGVDGLGEQERASFGTLMADGRVLMVTAAEFMSDIEGTDHPFPLVTVPRRGGAPDTLATRYAAHDRAMFVSGTADNIRSIQILQQIFSDVTTWAATPDGRALVLADRRPADGPARATWRLTRVGIDGDTAFSVEVPYEPVPVDPATVDSILARYTRGGRSEAEIRDVLFLPDFLPPVSDIHAAADGTVWVAREDRPDEAVTWEIFDGNGSLVARTATPAGFTAHRATGDALWGTETDDLDVPYVVRYRVMR